MNHLIFNLKNKLTWMGTRLRWINEEHALKRWIATMEDIYILMEKATRDTELWGHSKIRHRGTQNERQGATKSAGPHREQSGVPTKINMGIYQSKKKERSWLGGTFIKSKPTKETRITVDDTDVSIAPKVLTSGKKVKTASDTLPPKGTAKGKK